MFSRDTRHVMLPKQYWIVLLIVMVLFTGCLKTDGTAPEGFALVDNSNAFTAVSPEGMMLKTRIEDNYPEQSLDFWGTALKSHLEKEGYSLIREGTEGSEEQSPEVRYYEWGLPYGTDNYIYLTGIKPQGKYLIIIETAAEAGIYTKYRDQIIDNLASISLKRRFLFINK